ncbi:hypothetical protein JI435_420150, partial [Parastagonospora nodorum SN15]
IYRRIVRSLHSSMYREKQSIPSQICTLMFFALPKMPLVCTCHVIDKECGYHKGASICREKKQKREVVSHYLHSCSSTSSSSSSSSTRTSQPRPQ